ncbi:DUF1330 domain-containing protein [Propylenella binzhouense]|uniref:DUF1330 domain-containing protein n=1 Tax=Propylenella binzhouense TaxID=2555902 RepID=A0A964T6S3_9HYPH|nr:DUF1330 domain-containing protein [Propylenella binzhouense]MYZ49150.1 DUF1330 domain-containing protein [Propylenella binzhouense]
MAKGYWIARVDVRDPEAYKAYVEGAAEAFARHGGKFLARGGRCRAMEGQGRARNVVIEFPSYDAAVACYEDAVYQRARSFRLPASEGEIVIVEGGGP